MRGAPALRVGFVNFTRKWGGVKSWTLDFGTALRERGNGVLVVCRPRTPFPQACRARGLDVVEAKPGPKANPAAILRLWLLFGRWRPDVVVVNISRDLDIGAVAAKLRGIPVVHRVGLVEDYRRTRGERLRHKLLVDAVVVPAEWMKRALLDALPWLRAEEVHAVPNSKTLGPRAPLGGGARPVLGTSSQLSPSKGHTYLFQALELLHRDGAAFRLRVAGAGALEGELRAEVARRGLSDVVELAGFQTDMPAFLASLDAFVLPSLKEGFPNTLLEAMAVGLPVVSFRLDGAVEMAEGAGLLVPTGDAPALAEALRTLLGDAALRARLGGAARQRVEERFDLAKNAERLEAVLRKVAGP